MPPAQRQRTDNKFTVEEYLAWIEPRPKEERWQLIDGTVMLMNPPTIRHQSIAANLVLELNVHFRKHRPELHAVQEVGLIVPEVEMFRPEADVAVLDNSLNQETSWADRFYLVAEVLSESNTDRDIAAKRRNYVRHPDNLYVLIIDQTKIAVEMFARANGWAGALLEDADDVLDLTEFEFRLRVGELYRDTPLWVPPGAAA